MATTATGEPLAGATINRYVSQAGSLFKYAKRMKIVPRAFLASEEFADFLKKQGDRYRSIAQQANIRVD